MIKRKARKELGATTSGDLLFTFPPVSENTHIMLGPNNTVTGLTTADLGMEVLTSSSTDIIPSIGGVYDIGSTDFQWYDGFFSNSVNIDGGVIQGAAGTIAVNDVLIVDNVLSQLSDAPLYGHREIISEGGFTIASTDPAYLRLTQLPTPVTPDPISVNGSSMAYYNLMYYNNYSGSGNARFTWEEFYGPDVSSFFVPGDIYTITYFTGYSFITDNYEFVSTTNNMGVREVYFVSPNPGDGSSYYLGQIQNAIVITPPTVDDYTTVLSTYGSEGMIRFHPVTKEFEGHDGTAWAPLGVTPTVFVCGLNIGTCLTGGNGLYDSNTCHNIFFGQCAGYFTTYGGNNNFFGCHAGYCNEGGSNNNFFGDSAGFKNKGSFNNFFGCLTGNCNNFGFYNNFFGREAGRYNTDGSHNNFFGQGAGLCNTTGCYNNFFGRYAGRFNTTGSNNNFFGSAAGLYNTTGSSNNFFGFLAGRHNTTGSYNFFTGYCAGYNNTTGIANTFIGPLAGYCNTIGTGNNFFGAYAGFKNNGEGNIFLNSYAGYNNTLGAINFFAGTCAGYNNTTGSSNNFFGYLAGFCNTTGSSNFFTGNRAGYKNTTGCYNIFAGLCAGYNNTTACDNNFFGRNAGLSNTTGGSNNFFGSSAGLCNTTGISNNFFGSSAGRSNTTGLDNNFLGRNAGFCNTEGSYNDFFGQCAGRNNTTGSYNTFIGYRAGRCNTTGYNNLLFGCTSGVGAGGLANITTECNRIIMGNTSHTCAQIQIAWTVPSDVRDKCIFGSVPHGRGFLENVTPIEYAFKNRETNEITDPPGKRRYGFSAQEILALEGNDPVIVGNDNPEKFSLTTDYIIPILVNGFKELNAEVKQLRAEIELLKKSA